MIQSKLQENSQKNSQYGVEDGNSNILKTYRRWNVMGSKQQDLTFIRGNTYHSCSQYIPKPISGLEKETYNEEQPFTSKQHFEGHEYIKRN